MIERGIILAVMALAAITIAQAIRPHLSEVFKTISCELERATVCDVTEDE